MKWEEEAVEEEEIQPRQAFAADSEDGEDEEEPSSGHRWQSGPSWALGFGSTAYKASDPVAVYGRVTGRTPVGVGTAGTGSSNELFPDAVWLG